MNAFMRILILSIFYLFIGFEVSAGVVLDDDYGHPQDDLNGKGLICENSDLIKGYKFLKDFKVQSYTIEKVDGTIYDNVSEYSTTPILIKIGTYTQIDRLQLKLKGFDESCELVLEDLEYLIKKKLNEILNKIKQKRKI